jgi:hypothetical protein
MNWRKLTIKAYNDGHIQLELSDECTGATQDFKVPIQRYIKYFNDPNSASYMTTFEGDRCVHECFKTCNAYISFHRPTTLVAITQKPYDFAQTILVSDTDENRNEPTPEPLPIIHLVYNDDILESGSYHKRYAKVMNNSIWNYYIVIKPTHTKTERIESEDGYKDLSYDIANLQWAIEQIINNSFYMTQDKETANLYNLAICREYADLHARMLQQSYLSTLDGHGKAVAPFLFHQEQKMLEEIMDEPYIKSKGNKENKAVVEKKEEDNGQTSSNTPIPWKGTEISKYKWRILLLDDHVLAKMTLYDANEKETTSCPDKLRIISNTLRRIFSGIKIGYVDYNSEGKANIICDEQTRKEVDNNEYDIVFYCVSNITNAKTALRNHKFEIVLLDYLLEKDKNSNTREYSYTLLKYIDNKYKKTEEDEKEDEKEKEKEKEEEKEKYKFGPHKRMYFMFISSFATAVNERLLAEGLHNSEKYWHIAEGACPTNTPYLFLHRLLHLMHKRVKDMGIDKFMGINTKDEFKDSHILKYIINKIYDPKDKDNTISNVRSAANEYFDDVLSLLYHYKRMLEDYHKPEKPENVFLSSESTLATDFVDNHPKLGGFLEHLTQLVYLTAFGTVRQWPEMWEEYQFIRSITGERIESIEDHIYKLKTNS